jgi:anti-sigma-K factor RskA
MSEEEQLESGLQEVLALGVEPVDPPAGLRERILAAAAAPADDAVVPLRWRRRVRSVARLPFGAVAAALVVALLAGVLIGRITAPPPPPAQVVRFTLAGHGDLANVTANVSYLRSDRISVVTFQGLPLVESGKVYELWLITPDNRADAAAVFVPDVHGSAQVLVYRSLAHYKVMAVTVERGPDGVDAPTQQPQIYGTVV